MKFLSCFCFKRNRATYNVSSRKNSDADSNAIIPTITSVSLSSSSNTPIESNYESIIDLSVKRKITINKEPRISIISMDYDDTTELYATVDKTRKAKNALKRETDSTNKNNIALQQSPLSASVNASSSQPIFSSNSHSSNSTKTPKQFSTSSHVYMNVPEIVMRNNHHNAASRPRPYYDNCITSQSLPNHIQHSKINEEKQTQQYSSVNNSREIRNNEELYAKLSNDTASTSIYDSPPSRSYSQRSTDSNSVNNIKAKSTTKNVFQETDSVRF